MVDREKSMVGRRQVTRQPCGCGVARRAGCRPASRHVIRIRRSREVSRMAGIAVCRGACENVVDVATGAQYGGVRARQRERRVVMIEDRASP